MLITYKFAEINKDSINELSKKQIAFVKELKCFVYRSDENELLYFENNPDFKKAVCDSVVRTYAKQNYYRIH